MRLLSKKEMLINFRIADLFFITLVEKIEKHNKSMFSRGGKNNCFFKNQCLRAHPQGPVAASACNSLRFVFRNGGEEDVIQFCTFYSEVFFIVFTNSM